MQSERVTLFRDLDTKKDDFTLKVRVLRRWEVLSNVDKRDIIFVELVIMDEEGDRLQATLHKRFFKNRFSLLQENKSYVIKKSTLALFSKDIYYLLNKGHKISFLYNTLVKETDNFSGSKYGFTFSSFKGILDRTVPIGEGKIDVIGLVKICHTVEEKVIPSGKKSPLMKLVLQDVYDRELNVSLWEDYAKQMEKHILDNPNYSNVVLVMQFAVLGEFNSNYLHPS